MHKTTHIQWEKIPLSWKILHSRRWQRWRLIWAVHMCYLCNCVFFICICLCILHHHMIEDIILFTGIFYMRRLAWSWNDWGDSGFLADGWMGEGVPGLKTADLKTIKYNFDHPKQWKRRPIRLVSDCFDMLIFPVVENNTILLAFELISFSQDLHAFYWHFIDSPKEKDHIKCMSLFM